jgi:hypothetical protein
MPINLFRFTLVSKDLYSGITSLKCLLPIG